MSLFAIAKERFCHQPQTTTAKVLELTPAPSDLEIRAILAEHDCCPMIPGDAINFRPISFINAVGGRKVYELTWREANQLEDDPLSGGKPEVGLVRLRINPEYAAYLASLGLPTVHFENRVRAEYYLIQQQRTGLE